MAVKRATFKEFQMNKSDENKDKFLAEKQL